MLGIAFYISSLISEIYNFQNVIVDFYNKFTLKRKVSVIVQKINHILNIAAFNNIGDRNLSGKILVLRDLIDSSVDANKIGFFKNSQIIICDELFNFLKKYNALTEEIQDEIDVLKIVENEMNDLIKRVKI